MTTIPIACSLAPGDASSRVNEWRGFLDSHVTENVRTSTVARLRLRDEGESMLGAVDLARREIKCCAFLEFRFLIEADALFLEVALPDGAGVSLDDLSFLIAP